MPRPNLHQIITGPAGCGKTAHCLGLFGESILKSSQSGLNQPSYFILPNREHSDRIGELLLRDPRFRGVINFKVLTINDFVRLKVKRSERKTLTQYQRICIIKHVLADGNWTWFCNSLEESKFPYLLADFIREVKSGISNVERFYKQIGLLAKRDVYFGFKSDDLVLFLKKYNEAVIQLDCMDPEDEIWHYAKERTAPKSKRMDDVIFDGFFSFTEAQLAFIKAVANRSHRLRVTLTLPDRETESIFRYPLYMRKRLLAMGFREAPMPKRTYRFQNSDLTRLEKRLFDDAPESGMRETCGAVRLLQASHPRQEIEMIAREILKVQRSKGYYFSDFMVIFRDLVVQRSLIESVFREYGIPLDIHERKRLTDEAVIRFLLSWMKICSAIEGKNSCLLVDKSALLDFLKSPVLNTDRFALGEIERSLSLMSPAIEVSEIEAAASTLSNKAADCIGKVLGDVKRYFVLEENKQYCDYFKELLTKYWPESPNAREDVCLEKFWNLVTEILMRENRSNRPRMILLELAEGLEQGLYSFPAKDKNRVQVYDISLALQKEYRVVFVAGLVQGQFPRRIYQDPLLKDNERQFLNQGLMAFDTRKMKQSGECYYFYMAATRAKEKLYLAHTHSDLDGRQLTPSFFVEAVTKVFGGALGIDKKSSQNVVSAWDEAVSVRELTRSFCYQASQSDGGRSFLKLAALLERQGVLQNCGRPLDLLQHLARQRQRPRLEHDANRKWFQSRTAVWSAKKLTNASNCSYQYFARDVLGVGDRDPYAAPLQDGRILHQLLEEYAPGIFGKTPLCLDGLDQRLEELMKDHPIEGEVSHEQKHRGQSLRKVFIDFIEVERERLNRYPRYQPSKFEWSFGSHNALVLKKGDECISIRGRMDRVDIHADGKRAVVVDYKRSQLPTYDSILRREPASLQARIYLLAIHDAAPWKPVGLRLASVMSGSGKSMGLFLKEDGHEAGMENMKKGALDADAYEAYLNESRDYLFDVVSNIKACDIAPHPRSCSGCRLYGLCRFEDWRSLS